MNILQWVKNHASITLWVIGFAFLLMGIYLVKGWLQNCFLLLGSGCFAADRLYTYLKDMKSEE